jgi:murein DD-endopeptidase MepM/ murein hydrolase activator NlpD
VVSTGTRLGLVGDTGFTTGPHLHFEVRLREMNYYTTRNPELWLAPPQGWGLLVGRLTGWDGSPLPKIYVNVSSKENSDWWVVRTYANSQGLRSDPYYQENLVLSDLPEGDYTITFRLDGIMFSNDISIHPGLVTYFSFQRGRPFGSQPPPTPIATFLPVKP